MPYRRIMDSTLHDLSGLRRRIAAALVAMLAATPAAAFETVTLRLPDADERPELRDSLVDALLLGTLAEDESDDGDAVLAAAQADYTRLLETLYAQGYYGATVSILLDGREAARIRPLAAPPTVDRVTVTVVPGPLFALGVTEIGPRPPRAEPFESFRPGAPALATTVRDAARETVEGWHELGFAKARVADQDIIARHERNRLDAIVRVETGPRLRFGDVTVSGQSAVRAPRVREIAGIPRGERFSPDAVERAADRLRRTGTFRAATISEAETPNPDGTLDFTIDVIDRAPRRIGAGAEISTLEGLRLTGFWLHRNLLGGAERLRIEGEAAQLGGTSGGPDFSLSARFEKPAVYGPDTRFFAQALLDYVDEPDFLERTLRLETGATREFNDRLTGSLGLALQTSRVTDRFQPKDADGNYPERSFTLFSVPTSLEWDLRENALDPTDGYYIDAGLEPFAYLDGAGGGGAQATLDARAYRSLTDSLVLAGRVQLGALVGPEAENAPPEFLFYSGGGGTVRGQPFRSLDASYDGRSLGGRSFAGLSGELRLGVTEAISVVGFYDTGFVGADPGFAEGAWHSGAGLGLRYDTTIGPLRLDVAGPVAGDTGDGVQIYLGIGQAF
jgi:translocation and assembly module TamA